MLAFKSKPKRSDESTSDGQMFTPPGAGEDGSSSQVGRAAAGQPAAMRTVIGPDTRICGDVTSESAMTVAGAVEGNLRAAGAVEILHGAAITGDVSGDDVRVSGQVVGTVHARGKLVISSSGQVTGDIAVRSLLIEDGGTLQGQCQMGGGGTGGGAGVGALVDDDEVSLPPPPRMTLSA
jgi:cytoskeletal protein CcmA (bactofilin family)